MKSGASESRLRHILTIGREYLTHWAIAGVIIALTGFAPEHWFADLFQHTELPHLLTGLPAIDFRLVAVCVGVAIIVTNVVIQNRKQSIAKGQPRNATAFGKVGATQEIKYCRSADGVKLAYATAGNGPVLVKTGNWLNHLEYDWESPVWRHLILGLAKNHTLIRYDARGNGLSDWEVPELSLNTWVSDLEAVVDAAGLERFPLLGISQGCAVSIVYAAKHPQRVSKLILYGGFVLGAKKRSPEERDKRNALATLMRLGWGQDNPAFRQVFTNIFIPGATEEQKDFFNELERRTTTPELAAKMFDATGDIDLTAFVGEVRAPTLVMHARGDMIVPVDAGRALASRIPGARFVVLQGQNHLFLENEPATMQFFKEVDDFLKN